MLKEVLTERNKLAHAIIKRKIEPLEPPSLKYDILIWAEVKVILRKPTIKTICKEIVAMIPSDGYILITY